MILSSLVFYTYNASSLSLISSFNSFSSKTLTWVYNLNTNDLSLSFIFAILADSSLNCPLSYSKALILSYSAYLMSCSYYY